MLANLVFEQCVELNSPCVCCVAMVLVCVAMVLGCVAMVLVCVAMVLVFVLLIKRVTKCSIIFVLECKCVLLSTAL